MNSSVLTFMTDRCVCVLSSCNWRVWFNSRFNWYLTTLHTIHQAAVVWMNSHASMSEMVDNQTRVEVHIFYCIWTKSWEEPDAPRLEEQHNEKPNVAVIECQEQAELSAKGCGDSWLAVPDYRSHTVFPWVLTRGLLFSNLSISLGYYLSTGYYFFNSCHYHSSQEQNPRTMHN